MKERQEEKKGTEVKESFETWSSYYGLPKEYIEVMKKTSKEILEENKK